MEAGKKNKSNRQAEGKRASALKQRLRGETITHTWSGTRQAHLHFHAEMKLNFYKPS